MSRNGKKDVLGPSASIACTEEPASVDPAGNSNGGSPLEEFKWKPGQSGNPSGKSKVGDLKAEVRAFADEQDPKLRKTRLRQWLEMADRRARQGSPKHLEMLLAYGWGRPSQQIELDGNINYHDVLASVRRKRELAEADQTISQYFHSKPALPAPLPTNGHTDSETAKVATNMPDLSTARGDDAEQASQIAAADTPEPVRRVRVEL
jgi:hypothetical protein